MLKTEEPKIRLADQAKTIVDNNVYLCMSNWVCYIVKQDAFWNEDPECPLVYSDCEIRPLEPDENRSQEEEDEYYNFDFLEAWAVSDWLADELFKRGEWVARFQCAPNIWFRQTSGQMIMADAVIINITRDWLVRTGKCTKKEARALRFCDCGD